MGESQIATLPDSQNHHHVATGATAVIQTEVIRRGSDHVLVVKDRQPTLNGERMLQVRLPRGDERCAYAPWWSASGDLTARTIKARPAQGTPWWSASGVAPSFGCSIHVGVQVPTREVSAPGTGGLCFMVVSQWGLNSKNNQSRTGPGHSMVVSQWSSSEHRVLQSTWRTSAHPERCPRTARGGARVAAATDSTGRVHSELPNP